LPNLTAVVSIFAPVLAALGLLIAHRQWRTAQNKLKLDLFEKRLRVYEAVDKFIMSQLRKHGDKTQVEQEFLEALRSARWLFGKPIVSFCNSTIWGTAMELQELWEEADIYKKDLDEERGDQETLNKRSIAIGKIPELKRSLMNHRKQWEELVAPYMALQIK